MPLEETWEPSAPEHLEEESAFLRPVELIRSMPETYRQVLELRCAAGWTAREFACPMGLSESAVSKRIERGRALLIEKLRDEGYAYERR